MILVTRLQNTIGADHLYEQMEFLKQDDNMNKARAFFKFYPDDYNFDHAIEAIENGEIEKVCEGDYAELGRYLIDKQGYLEYLFSTELSYYFDFAKYARENMDSYFIVKVGNSFYKNIK